MSIPLDHLYHHLEDLCGEDVIIYRWNPHGSKNLKDLVAVSPHDLTQKLSMPILIAHDQEPLCYEHFESQDNPRIHFPEWLEYESHNKFVEAISKLRVHVGLWNVHDKMLLCHSEKNSPEFANFESDFIRVYYWSHAVIARDWFRFAEHDNSLTNNPANYKYDFLIYNRAWTGTREYRLKFTELLIDADLIVNSNIKFSEFDSGLRYTSHKFKNPKFTITDYTIQNKIPANTASSNDSGGYVSSDYNTCGIEIVLETLFDDTRQHLTEKILRSIACGKPFILASTPGSLQYLRDYGFKTFDGLIDESYDQVQDSSERLNCIVAEMDRIRCLPQDKKTLLFQQLSDIAAYNKTLFFSKEWHNQIINEFKHNVRQALVDIKSYRNATVWGSLKHILDSNPEMNRDFTKKLGDYNVTLLNSISSKVS